MSLSGTIDEKGVVDNVQENESSTIRRGGDGGNRNRSTRRAFSKRANSDGNGSGSDSGSESPGDIDTVGSDPIREGNHERIESSDRSGEELERTSSGHVDGSGSPTKRSRGALYGIEPRRNDESPAEYERRYKREYKRWKRQQDKLAETERDSSRDQIDSVIDEDDSFAVTVEAAPVIGGEIIGTAVKKEAKATPRAKKGSKYKEPNKDSVALLASSLQDIYSLTDGGISLASILMNKFYIPGTFELDPDKAEKMAHALARMNVSTPKLAEYINKYSAPLTFFSVMALDLVAKGVMIRGQWSSQQPTNIGS